MHITQAALFIVLLTAVLTDLRSGKIKNWLTFPAIAAGPVLHLLQGGKQDVLPSLLGLAAMIAVCILLIAFRLMGGGDIKLLAAVGSLAGIQLVVPILLYTAFAGGLMALLLLIKRKSFVQTAAVVALRLSTTTKCPLPSECRTKMPYSIAIAAGTIAAYFWRF